MARFVEERRGAEAPALLRIEPGETRFDPKNCVAIGAAIWGANRNNGSWLEIRNYSVSGRPLESATGEGPVIVTSRPAIPPTLVCWSWPIMWAARCGPSVSRRMAASRMESRSKHFEEAR